MIEPIAITVTGELPEIAAKNMHDNTAAAAMPPGNQPTSASATSTMRRAIPPAVMSEPAMMKYGIASRTFLSVSVKIFSMISWYSAKSWYSVARKKKQTNVSTPSVTNSGVDRVSSKKIVPMTMKAPADAQTYNDNTTPANTTATGFFAENARSPATSRTTSKMPLYSSGLIPRGPRPTMRASQIPWPRAA